MLFSYGYARHKIDNRKKWTCFASHYVGHAYQGYGTERITQYGRSRATLDATGRHHWASSSPVLPRQTPWSSILAQKLSCGIVEIAFQS